ncbi:diguanylate cyclase [Pleionea sp. CnH1-48]|uniref:diguanylate cyclase n=1 Tax=Pleionea sp. CnH1-48 TaxID=2954494 RepID=UPI002096A54C|nr:diguanylate cyclase [Pleionea sp. CnH1-48]MCO7223177.1 diguanylate cyclase [Pleionea sp. CnH1-48]
MPNNKLIYSGVLCIISLLMIQSVAANSHKKRVLVLHAYHHGFHWTDRIMAGMLSVFDERDDVELFVNYMDTKRHSGEQYFEQLKDIYAVKFQHAKFDAIISSDDHALDFLLKYRDELFPDVPVVFSGLNDFDEDRLGGQKGYTGIYESYDVAGTIELMLALHPEAKNIYAITDNTRSGLIFKNLLHRAESQFLNRARINHLHNLSPETIQSTVSSLPENSLVLWAIYLRTPSGATLSSEESVKLVSQASDYPTYCVWDVVGQGVVGGKITSPNFQGQTAANIALRIMRGKPVDDIPVKGSPLVNIFDHHLLERFDINNDDILESSIILNKPVSFYQQYQGYIWALSIIILLLVVAIIFLSTIILLKRKRDQFEGMAMHDQLTGLYNRYYLEEASSKIWAEAARHQLPISLLILDLDLFKNINDTHGHAVGDCVLKELAHLLNEQTRSEDIVARIGGEEFLILFNRCHIDEAKARAHSIRQQVADLNPHSIPVTVSIGVAELCLSDGAFEVLFERADKAVYQAKENGRNCVVCV